MPYSGPSDPELPAHVRDEPESRRSQWVAVLNSAFEKCQAQESPGDDCEAVAFRMANGVVFEEMALFTPPADLSLGGVLSALDVRLLAEKSAPGATWARRIVTKLDEAIMSALSEAKWTTAFINRLPDSSFLHILSGGEKDENSKTTPRSLRMFPYKDSAGKVDLPHLRNALARIPQSDRIDAATQKRLTSRARRILQNETKEAEALEMYADTAVVYTPQGPTSFADLRAAEQASEAADTVRKLTYQFQTLVDNIMGDGEVDDKGAAIEALAGEFVGLVRETIGGEMGESALAESMDLHADGLAVEVARDATDEDLSEAGVEHAAENGRRAPVVVNFRIMKPGPGNKRDNHYYPAEVLRRDIHVFEGVDVFATDHKDAERNERTKVGQVLKCPTGFMEDGAPVAPILIYDPYQAEKARNRHDAEALRTLECSIFGNGRAKKGEIDGKEYKVVEALTKGIFVELVSKAGAGGQAQSLAESEVNMSDEDRNQETELEEVVIEEEAQAPESQETEPQETEAMLEAETVNAELEKTNLPTAFIVALGAVDYTDADALQEAIAQATEEIKTLTGSGQPFAQGESQPANAAPLSKTELEERATARFNDIMVQVGLQGV